MAFLKHRAVIEIPFPHETADKHKTGTTGEMLPSIHVPYPVYPIQRTCRIGSVHPLKMRNKFRTTKPKMNELADRLA